MYGCIIFAVVSAVFANVHGKCPDVTPVDNFDLKAYGNGIWYEVGRYPNIVEGRGNCGFANYKLEGDIISINNTDVYQKKRRSIGGSAKLAEDAGKTGKLVNIFPYGGPGVTTKAILWILATDYSNYSVAYYCKYNEKQDKRTDFVWILSRSKKLEGDAKTAVDKILSESTIIDSSKLIWPDFSDEACEVEA